ncbi:MAG: YhjD/YihY/BrkB family envelope integrity protein [Smithellaceae bacterium]
MAVNGKDRGKGPATRQECLRMSVAALGDIVIDAVKNFSSNSNGNQAAAIAFYAILSSIPLFILTIIAAGYVFTSQPDVSQDIITAIRHFHPYFSGEVLVQLGGIESKQKVLGWLGLLALVWFSAMIFTAVESSLNNIFPSEKKRNYFASKALAVSMIPLGWLIGLASVVLSYVAALLAEQPLVIPGVIDISLSGASEILLRYLVPYLIMVLFINFVYRVIPKASIPPAVALVGAAVFGLLVEIAKQFFTWYLANYTRYDIIFGSLEAVVILVIWVFYVALMFLFCAEIMSSYLRRDMLLLERALLKPHAARFQVDERLYRKFGRIYHRGDIIFNEGDPGNEMFYILSGRVHLEHANSPVTKTLADMSQGQYFGEMAALMDVTRTATARAAEESQLAVIDADTFRHLIRENGDAALFMLQELSGRLKNSNATLEETLSRWIRLVILVYLMDETGTKLEDHLHALSEITRRDPAAVRKLVDKLVAQGFVIIEEGRITAITRNNIHTIMDDDMLEKCRQNMETMV